MKRLLLAMLLLFVPASPAGALDRPWIGDVFFYWYTWDAARQWGWEGGVHNTPLDGYYDSHTLAGNRRSLWTASEWGMTHHFMDYWSPDWKADDGRMREAVVIEAAEQLRREGYDVWMSYYQDGENFAMREFSKNVSEKRDVHQWLRDFAKSPVWPKLDGRPFQMVYARNGAPQTTIDHEGFRRFLKDRYPDVAALKKEWNAGFASFDEIEMDFSARGHQRAASIECQYSVWRREWDKLDGLVKHQFGFPGMRASFDVGYGPFAGFGFADFARVFGGPHSYAGIFGPPEEQDAQRFIQAAVARRYGAVFFDHLKNHYFDWNIRTPGIAYLPDPHHFDRFWLGALMRKSEAVLHMSWNEWWEGSNLEPSQEFGKTYCEKNLFYATLMKLCFDSIRNAGRDANVGLLLNDWRFLSGAGGEEELYETVQVLRRLGVPFDLVPDEFVTAEELARFKLVVAPTFRCGLGHNGRREPIAVVLAAWLRGGDRRLILSDDATLSQTFGLEEKPLAAPESAPGKPGPDLNVLIDVGAEDGGDEQFLRDGRSGRETGMVSGDDRTFRWTPGEGLATRLVLPASPGRAHVLRIRGNAIWPNTIALTANGLPAGKIDVPAGAVAVEAKVPAAAAGPVPVVELELRFAKANVPGKLAPQNHPGETRVCNLAINWLQWSTDNVPAGEKKSQYAAAEDGLRLDPKLFGELKREVALPLRPRRALAAPGATVLSTTKLGGAPRDLSVPFGPGRLLYTSGPLSETLDPAWWLPVIRGWAGVKYHRYAFCRVEKGPQFMAGRLAAGDTEFILAVNEARPEVLTIVVPEKDVPLSEAVALMRDGRPGRTLTCAHYQGVHEAVDQLEYFGVYQFAFSPLRIETPRLSLQPGEEREFPVTVTNLTEKPLRGTVQPGAVIPTIAGPAAEVDLGPGEKKTVKVRLRAAPTADWGRKTIYFTLTVGDRRAVVLRELVVLRPPEVKVSPTVLSTSDPRITIEVVGSPHGETAPLPAGTLALPKQLGAPPLAPGPLGHEVAFPAVGPGERWTSGQLRIMGPEAKVPSLEPATVRIGPGPLHAGPPIERRVFLARRPPTLEVPPTAAAALVVYNAVEEAMKDSPVTADLRSLANPPAGKPRWEGPFVVLTEERKLVPSLGKDVILFPADVPPRGVAVYHLYPGNRNPHRSDLKSAASDLGTGKGTLTVENAFHRVTLSEAAGGTVTGLVSHKTGRDYARKSFGVNYGTFSRHDPGQPQTDTVQYIQERKTRQEDSPGRIKVEGEDETFVIATVTWSDGKVEVRQRYQFSAAMPEFSIWQSVEPKGLAPGEELVAMNGALAVQHLTKTYPNFVGIRSDREQPHFGWRMGSWVPPLVTFTAPPGFEESVSFLIEAGPESGLTGVRQGFWPAERPKPGKCEIAQLELLAARGKTAEFTVTVLVHPGNQAAARARAEARKAVEVTVVERKGLPRVIRAGKDATGER